MNKIFFIDKKEGVSSYDVIRELKHKLNTNTIGHSGTLDPFASGILTIMVGETTKISNYLMADKKEYVAELKLGSSTDSLDLTGNVIESKDVPSISNEDIINVFNKFIGSSKQIPPMYSAIKKNGVKMYDLARKGIELELEARDINIYELELLSFKDNVIKFRAVVSKGTYIRTLGYDIALALNTIGHLISLRRTKCGKIDIDKAINVDEVKEELGYDIKDVLDMKKIVIDEPKVKNGEKINLDEKDQYVLLINEDGKEIAIYEKDEGFYRSKRGFNL